MYVYITYTVILMKAYLVLVCSISRPSLLHDLEPSKRQLAAQIARKSSASLTYSGRHDGTFL